MKDPTQRITAIYQQREDGQWQLVAAFTVHCAQTFIDDLKTSLERNGEKVTVRTYDDVLEITKKGV